MEVLLKVTVEVTLEETVEVASAPHFTIESMTSCCTVVGLSTAIFLSVFEDNCKLFGESDQMESQGTTCSSIEQSE